MRCIQRASAGDKKTTSRLAGVLNAWPFFGRQLTENESEVQK
jgi:hypothetical protein